MDDTREVMQDAIYRYAKERAEAAAWSRQAESPPLAFSTQKVPRFVGMLAVTVLAAVWATDNDITIRVITAPLGPHSLSVKTSI